MMRVRTLVLLFACGGCVATNPAWDGVGGEAGTTADTPSTDAGSESSDAGTTAGATLGPGRTETSGDIGSDTLDASSGGDGSSDGGASAVCAESPPAMGTCPATCAGCPDDVCPISCVGEKACDKTILMCPKGQPCRVECSGKDACKDAKIACPHGHACEVICSGEHSCEKAVVTCGDRPCDVQCSGHPQACTDLRVACGGGDTLVTCDQRQDMPAPKLEPAMGPAMESGCACGSDGCS
jgi:hypothetical protein